MKRVFLSHTLSADTPTYGDRTRVELRLMSSIAAGDAANNTEMAMSLHSGTHADMPRHFFADGQTINDYPADFWVFNHPLCVDIRPEGHIINQELKDALAGIKDGDTYDCIIVRTGFDRQNRAQLMENFGFHESLAGFIRNGFKNVRLLGFDTMSVSSFAERMEGRKAHRAFLDPTHPIILLEDMNLKDVDIKKISRLTILPLRVENADGLPCTVMGELID